MPGKRPLRRMLFRQRGRGTSLATASPDDWSPMPPPPALPPQAQPQSLSPDPHRHQQKHEKQEQQQQQKQQRRDWSLNNTDYDNDTSEEAAGAGPGGSGSQCSEDQVERLKKCQKSLDQLEFSLNNLMLGLSLAPRSQRRLIEADRFFSDLVDSIRANRTSRRPRRRPLQAKPQKQQMTAAELTMRRKLEDESRALWRAQHIGARCEDTVDRYMLDVVMDRLGDMAAAGGGNGRRQKTQHGGRSRRRQKSGSSACGKCGGLVREVSDEEGDLSGEGSEDGLNRGGGNRHNSCSMLSFATDGHSGGITFAKRLPESLGHDARQGESQEHQQKQQPQLHRLLLRESISDTGASQDRWTLRTWQPTVAAQSSGTNNNNCCPPSDVAQSSGTNNNNCCPPSDVAQSSGTNISNCCRPAVLQPEKPRPAAPCEGRRATDLAASVTAYRRGSRRYAKALRVAAYLRDLCREFYRTGCAGRAPPVANDLEWIMVSLAELVAMRDRVVALAVRCTGCPGLCPAERLSSPQLCRLRGLLRLACTKGDCAGGSGGLLDLTEALAYADRRPDRCRLLRQLRAVAAHSDRPDADYQRLINALAGQTELANCAANYSAHRRRMCGTAPPVTPGPRGLSRADMRALAIDLAPIEAKASAPCRRLRRRPLRRGPASPLTQALHNPEEMRRRLRMHQFATGASLAVKAEEGFPEA